MQLPQRCKIITSSVHNPYFQHSHLSQDFSCEHQSKLHVALAVLSRVSTLADCCLAIGRMTCGPTIPCDSRKPLSQPWIPLQCKLAMRRRHLVDGALPNADNPGIEGLAEVSEVLLSNHSLEPRVQVAKYGILVARTPTTFFDGVYTCGTLCMYVTCVYEYRCTHIHSGRDRQTVTHSAH